MSGTFQQHPEVAVFYHWPVDLHNHRPHGQVIIQTASITREKGKKQSATTYLYTRSISHEQVEESSNKQALWTEPTYVKSSSAIPISGRSVQSPVPSIECLRRLSCSSFLPYNKIEQNNLPGAPRVHRLNRV